MDTSAHDGWDIPNNSSSNSCWNQQNYLKTTSTKCKRLSKAWPNKLNRWWCRHRQNSKILLAISAHGQRRVPIHIHHVSLYTIIPKFLFFPWRIALIKNISKHGWKHTYTYLQECGHTPTFDTLSLDLPMLHKSMLTLKPIKHLKKCLVLSTSHENTKVKPTCHPWIWITDTVKFLPHKTPIPQTSSLDIFTWITQGPHHCTSTLSPAPAIPILWQQHNSSLLWHGWHLPSIVLTHKINR